MRRKTRIVLRIEERLAIRGGQSAGGKHDAVPTAPVSQSKKEKDKPLCNEER
jgi:hypothetical protein